MTITEYIKELEEFIKCREAATPGEWDDLPATKEWKANKVNNAAFCRLAANKSADIARNLIEALKVIEYYGSYYVSNLEGKDLPEAAGSGTKARDFLAKISGGKNA